MSHRDYAIFSIVTGLIEAAAIVAIVLWLLPVWGVNIPIWVLVLLMVAFGAYQFITYRIGKKALDRKPKVSPETVVGCCGKAITRLAPYGYVRVEGELWQASSVVTEVDEGEEIVVVGITRLKLFVKLSLNHQHPVSQES